MDLYYNVHPFLGFPGQKLLHAPYNVQKVVNMPVFILNVYRQIAMSQCGQYRLTLEKMETDDIYLDLVLISQRFKQITISQKDLSNKYIISIKNSLDMEMCITTEHIRCQNGRSAIIEDKLCNKVQILKLSQGKSLEIELKKEQVPPTVNDIYRQLQITWSGGKNIQDTFQHDVVYEKLNLQVFNGILLEDLIPQINQALNQSFEILETLKHVRQQLTTNSDVKAFDTVIQIENTHNIIQIIFKGVPTCVVNSVLCLIHKEAMKICLNLKLNEHVAEMTSIAFFLQQNYRPQEQVVHILDMLIVGLDETQIKCLQISSMILGQ